MASTVGLALPLRLSTVSTGVFLNENRLEAKELNDDTGSSTTGREGGWSGSEKASRSLSEKVTERLIPVCETRLEAASEGALLRPKMLSKKLCELLLDEASNEDEGEGSAATGDPDAELDLLRCLVCAASGRPLLR